MRLGGVGFAGCAAACAVARVALPCRGDKGSVWDPGYQTRDRATARWGVPSRMLIVGLCIEEEPLGCCERPCYFVGDLLRRDTTNP